MRIPEISTSRDLVPPAPGAGRAPRIAMYSHDTQGLGHIRRNLLISRALSRGGLNPIILLLSGLREATAFGMPPGVDCLTLPSLGKGVDGEYFPRSLEVPMSDLMKVRCGSIGAALKSFAPDVLIVDKAPRGVFDELIPSLQSLRARGRTSIVLGLREILDAPEAVRREWRKHDYETVIRTFYDRIWIYGDPAVYDTAREYAFAPDLVAKSRYTGYLNPREWRGDSAGDSSAPRRDGDEPSTLCLVGGGRDGLPLAEAFLRARLPGPGVLVTGPLMPGDGRDLLRTLAAARPEITLHEFFTDPCPLIAEADRVIAMGGYNTTCEILAYGKPALVVPRTEPRTEQLIRASRFADRGLVDMVHPSKLTADAIGAWVATSSLTPRNAVEQVDFDGSRRLVALLDEVLDARQKDLETTHAIG